MLYEKIVQKKTFSVFDWLKISFLKNQIVNECGPRGASSNISHFLEILTIFVFIVLLLMSTSIIISKFFSFHMFQREYSTKKYSPCCWHKYKQRKLISGSFCITLETKYTLFYKQRFYYNSASVLFNFFMNLASNDA